MSSGANSHNKVSPWSGTPWDPMHFQELGGHKSPMHFQEFGEGALEVKPMQLEPMHFQEFGEGALEERPMHFQ